MYVLEELLLDRAGLPDDVVAHLQRLLSDWQILADLSFADLLLFVRHAFADGRPAFLCAGQIRPYTAQTIYNEDLVGQMYPAMDRPIVARAFAEHRVIRDADPDWSTGVPVREEAIPVCFSTGDRASDVVAVVTREANLAHARSPSPLELTYLKCAGELAQMLADGTFPYAEATEGGELSPRVGDGIVRIETDGEVGYASPNAISAYRRLGLRDNILGQRLTDFDPGGEQLLDALALGRSVEEEVERQGAYVIRRLLPLVPGGTVSGALLLVREVTELRRSERALRLKDATIREIHHRVKNNLQTVASLLRLQARRLNSDEARDALAESVRRISSIALVHETLSVESRERVSFEKVARRIIDMLADGLIDPDVPITFEVEGSSGELPADIATPLALVLTELLQNGVEHAFPDGPPSEEPARVTTAFRRLRGRLHVTVRDNGVGFPGGGAEEIANLGLQIVRTLVTSELGGTFSARNDRGAVVELELPTA